MEELDPAPRGRRRSRRATSRACAVLVVRRVHDGSHARSPRKPRSEDRGVVRVLRRTRATCRRPARASWRGSGDTGGTRPWGRLSPADRWGTRRSPSRRRRRRVHAVLGVGRRPTRQRTFRVGELPSRTVRSHASFSARGTAPGFISRFCAAGPSCRLHGGARVDGAVVRRPISTSLRTVSCRGSARPRRRRHACDVRARDESAHRVADHVHLRGRDALLREAVRSPRSGVWSGRPISSIRAFDFDAFGEADPYANV